MAIVLVGFYTLYLYDLRTEAFSVQFTFFFFFFFRERGREEERERNISVSLPLTRPPLGTWPVTQACALTGN